jgi:hypothetical protein
MLLQDYDVLDLEEAPDEVLLPWWMDGDLEFWRRCVACVLAF